MKFTHEDLEERLGPVVDLLRGDEPLSACEHVFLLRTPPVICALHPGMGLHCADCWERFHVDRHDERPVCLFCEAQALTRGPMVVEARPTMVNPGVTETEAVNLGSSGEVEVGSVMLCDEHADQWNEQSRTL